MLPTELLALAPDDLPNQRERRFDGSGFEVRLGRFAPSDQRLLRRVYDAVWGLARRAGELGADPAAVAPAVRAATAGLLAEVQRLGAATRDGAPADPAVRKALHDIRGGGLTVLLGAAELFALGAGGASLGRTCLDAARDHAKIMRNLLPEIDPAVRAADEAAKAHGIGHFTTKWDGATVAAPGGPVAVEVRCAFGGNVSARCLETSSIDRVVYNYINNAARFAADGRLVLWVFPVGAALVRWVVANRVDAAQAAFLAAAAPDPARLFAGGVTRGGTGVGLANCAEIVADCFGLRDPGAAVRGGYLGAKLVGTEYLAWFHWPAYVSGGAP